jgi:hypothetical protein
MSMDRRELLVAAAGSAIPLRIPGVTKKMYGLFHRKIGDKSWASFGAYDTYEECEDAAATMLEGGPYEFRIVCLNTQELV